MRNFLPASILLVLPAALLVPVVGCGRVANTSALQPVDSSPSTGLGIAPGGLQLGYVWQKDSQNLYPVVGVTGSARFGDGILPTSVPVAVAAAVQGPNASWAVALDQDGTLRELDLPTGLTSAMAAHIPLDSALVLSPAGSAAALGSASAHSVVVVTGLPSGPRVSTLMLPGGVLSGVAVSDAGTVIAGISRLGSTGTEVTMISETHPALVLGNVHSWGGAAFVPSAVTGSGAEAAVFADSASAQVSYAGNLSGASPAVIVLGNGGLLHTPNAVGVSANGKWTYVSDNGKQQVVRLSLLEPASPPSAIACGCNPQAMVPQTTDGIFALTSGSLGQPSWLLDTRVAEPRTFFVPALVAATGPGTGQAVRTGGSR